ncbi:MAG TPA: site-specific integrase [Acetobacteraceae bacterium]|nr:site-specific integrase [Acetobacteraceae bacterium]
MQARLTADAVRRILDGPAPAKITDYFDTVLPRFFLRCRPRSEPQPKQPRRPFAATYFVRYVTAGAERRMKVGDARVLAVDEARLKARKELAKADTGDDPVRKRRAQRHAWTWADALTAYLAAEAHTNKAPGTRRREVGIVQHHLATRIGKLPLSDLDISAARRLRNEIEADHRHASHHRRLGGAGAARKALRVLSAISRWLVEEGRLSSNPIAGLRLGSDGERETILASAEDYAALLTTLNRMVAESRMRESVRVCIVLIAATGLRRTEATDLTWGAVDLQAGRLTLRNTKGVRLRRNGPQTEHVGLPPIAREALTRIQPDDPAGSDPVFPARSGAFRINVLRGFKRACREAGLPGELTIHSLRHSVGSHGAMQGLSAHELQALLRHRDTRASARYIHFAERQQAALASRAMEAVLPAPERPAGDVAPLPRRGR